MPLAILQFGAATLTTTVIKPDDDDDDDDRKNRKRTRGIKISKLKVQHLGLKRQKMYQPFKSILKNT